MGTLWARLGQELPERNYLGLDVGYKEHVATVISLETFIRGGDRWKRARCGHFPSTQKGLDKFQRHLDSYNADPQTFLGICEPTGGGYGATERTNVDDRERVDAPRERKDHGGHSPDGRSGSTSDGADLLSARSEGRRVQATTVAVGGAGGCESVGDVPGQLEAEPDERAREEPVRAVAGGGFPGVEDVLHQERRWRRSV